MSSDRHEAQVLNNGLKIKVCSEGTGACPSPGDLVHISYNTFIGNRTPVEKNTRFAFVVGKDQALEALDRGVATMALGEVAKITASPEYAYGAQGHKPLYGPNDCITFEVTLNENLGHFNSNECLPLVSRLTLADSLRERGNFLFVRNENERAIRAYKTALGYMFEHPQTYDTSREEDCQMGIFMVKTYNNLAAGYLRVGNFKEADRCATTVVQLDQTNAKGLYRKGMALKGLGDYTMALCFLQCALQAEPSSDKIKSECCSVAALIECGKKEEKLEGTIQTIPEQSIPESEDPPMKFDEALQNVQNGDETTEDETKEEINEPVEESPAEETNQGKSSLPSWVKWAAGAAAVVGAGYLIYKIFK